MICQDRPLNQVKASANTGINGIATHPAMMAADRMLRLIWLVRRKRRRFGVTDKRASFG